MLVAFLDILGYRKVLEGMDHLPLPTDPEQVNLMRSSLARAVKLRRRLVATFPEFLRAADSVTPIFDDLSPTQRRLAESFQKVRIVKSPGPDHYIVAASLSPSAEHFPMRAIYSIFTGSASAMLVQLGLGAGDPTETLPLRGGIDIAPGTFMEPEEVLYSPAIVRAYNLETNAIYPRIVIGTRVLQFLDSIATNEAIGPGGELAQQLARRCQGMLVHDTDGAVILDFYGPMIRESVGPENGPLEVGQHAWVYAQKALVAAQQAAVKAVTDDERKEAVKILAKYQWLVDYMRPRAHLWA